MLLIGQSKEIVSISVSITRGTARSNMKVSIFGEEILSSNFDASMAF